MLKHRPLFRNNKKLIEEIDDLLYVLNEMKKMNNNGEEKEYIEYKRKKYRFRKEMEFINSMIEYLETVKKLVINKKVPKDVHEREKLSWNFYGIMREESHEMLNNLSHILRVASYFESGYIFNPPYSIVLEGIEDE